MLISSGKGDGWFDGYDSISDKLSPFDTLSTLHCYTRNLFIGVSAADCAVTHILDNGKKYERIKAGDESL
jgi:hypothetical protein